MGRGGPGWGGVEWSGVAWTSSQTQTSPIPPSCESNNGRSALMKHLPCVRPSQYLVMLSYTSASSPTCAASACMPVTLFWSLVKADSGTFSHSESPNFCSHRLQSIWTPSQRLASLLAAFFFGVVTGTSSVSAQGAAPTGGETPCCSENQR